VSKDTLIDLLRRALMVCVIGIPVAYALDYLSLRLGIPHRETFGVVQVERYYTVPRKDGKLEYYADDPVPQKCVRSLFPQMGFSPCWALKRAKNQRVDE
jgi:hypothetical protein